MAPHPAHSLLFGYLVVSLSAVLLLLLPVSAALSEEVEPVLIEESFYVDYATDELLSLEAVLPCESDVASQFPLPQFDSISESAQTLPLEIPETLQALGSSINVTASVYAAGGGFTMFLYAVSPSGTSKVAEKVVVPSKCADIQSIIYTKGANETRFFLKFQGDELLLLDPRITFSTVARSVVSISPLYVNRKCNTPQIFLVGALSAENEYRVYFDGDSKTSYKCDFGVCEVEFPEEVSMSVVHVTRDGNRILSQIVYFFDPIPGYISKDRSLVSLSPGSRFLLSIPSFQLGHVALISDLYRDILTISFEGVVGSKPISVSPIFPPTLRSSTEDLLELELHLPYNVDVDTLLSLYVNFGDTCFQGAGTFRVVRDAIAPPKLHVQEVTLKLKDDASNHPAPYFCFGELGDFSPFGYLTVTLFQASNHEIDIYQLLGTSGMILDSISVETRYKGPGLDLHLGLGEESHLNASYGLPAHDSCLQLAIIEWEMPPGKVIVSSSTSLSARYVSGSTELTYLLPARVFFRFHFAPDQFQAYIPLTRLFRDCESNSVQIHGFDIHSDDPPVRVEVQGDRIDSSCDVSDRKITLCELPDVRERFVDVYLVEENRNLVLYTRRLYFFDYPTILHRPIKGSPLQVMSVTFNLGNNSFDVEPSFLFQFSHVLNDGSLAETQTTSFYPPLIKKYLVGPYFNLIFSLPDALGATVSESVLTAILPNSCSSPEITRVIYTHSNSTPSPLPPTPSPSPYPVDPTPSLQPSPDGSSPPEPAPSPSPSKEPLDSKKRLFDTVLEFIEEHLMVVVVAGLSIVLLIVGVCFVVCSRFCRKSRRVRSDVNYQSLKQSEGSQLSIIPADLRLLEEIGRGAFAIVYRGKWRGVEVAIKKIVNAKSMEDVEELFRESKTMMSLRHPHIISYLGTSADRETIYIVTAYASMGPLKKILRNKSYVFQEGHLYDFVSQVARGMDYLHTQGLIHRDLKSDNVLVDCRWKLKVADFGLSKHLKDEKEHTLTAVGTPFWAAPEILRSSKYSLKADVYRLAQHSRRANAIPTRYSF